MEELNIDIERLRSDLKDYFGTAIPTYPMAVGELIQVEKASEYELILIAERNGFDLSNYKNQKTR